MVIDTNIAIASMIKKSVKGEFTREAGINLVLFSFTRKNISAPNEKGSDPAGIEKYLACQNKPKAYVVIININESVTQT